MTAAGTIVQLDATEPKQLIRCTDPPTLDARVVQLAHVPSSRPLIEHIQSKSKDRIQSALWDAVVSSSKASTNTFYHSLFPDVSRAAPAARCQAMYTIWP